MTYKIICLVEVKALTEEEALRKITRASNYEKWFGVTITPVDLKKKFAEPKKDGSKDTKT